MTWRQINGYQYPYRINEEAQAALRREQDEKGGSSE